ncbi:MAG: protein phosphatase 2C domain-containing protein [Deltaproteobacteria bacterium]|jgi:protein phosphatase|nr:protein phosphatase 2C domain-containing protein [Deltaproteobacteria bacterium]
MRSVFFTNIGAVRTHNEDALLSERVFSGENMRDAQLMELKGNSIVVAVADGVGGEPGGAEAAKCLLSALIALNHQPFGADATSRLEDSIILGINDMARISDKSPELTGMATTVAGLWTDGEKALVFNCGDCRIYRFRQGFLEQLSKDHSVVYELYLSGDITESEMQTHPRRHVLTSSIRDKGENPRVYLRELSILKGDSYFLCSDGVWDSVPLKELEEILASAPPLQAAQSLAERLLAIGTKDNSTFLWLM